MPEGGACVDARESIRYCFQVVPSEFGVSRPWHFVVTDPIKWLRRRSKKAATLHTDAAVTKVETDPAAMPVGVRERAPFAGRQRGERERLTAGGADWSWCIAGGISRRTKTCWLKRIAWNAASIPSHARW